MEAFKGSSISEQVAGSLTRNSAAALAGADSAQEYRHAGHYTQRALRSRNTANFSQDIRQGVPGIAALSH